MYRARPNNGFALVITITLLAFLMLLLLSFSALTRVETQAAGNAQQLSQARQNALLALGIALGELQRMTGPDQRTTATADIRTGTQSGTRTWTGVWGNAKAADDYASAPQLLSWLVSGNEASTFTASTAATDFGRISEAASPAFTPSDSVSLGSASAKGALATDTQIDSVEARLLVGPGSAANSGDYVIAPLVSVNNSPSAPTATDRYAWWVGDEGVKARLNLVDPRVSTADNAQERFYRLLTAQRHGIELMSKDAASVFGDTLYNVESTDAAADNLRSQLQNTLHYTQAALLDGFDNEAIRTALMRRSADLTVWSRGVLTDQLRGGLRRDLTVLFESEPSNWSEDLKTSLDSVSAFDTSGIRRIADFQDTALYSNPAYSMSTNVSPDIRSPLPATWEQIHNYATAAGNTGTVNARSQTQTRAAIAPLVQRFGLALDVSANTDGSNGQLHFFPHVVLWNPYNVTLRGSYRVRFEFAFGGSNDTTARRIYFVTPRRDSDGYPIEDFPYEAYHTEPFIPTSGTHAIPANTSRGKYHNRTLEFTIPDVDIPPGQARVFTVDPANTGPYETSGDNPLAPGYNTTASFTRSLSHTFTPEQLEFTAVALANGNASGSHTAGGRISMHLLDADSNPLQTIDGIDLSRRLVVAANDGNPTQLTGEANGGRLGNFRDITDGNISSRNQMGLSAANALQQTDGRYNWLAHYNQRAPSTGKAWMQGSSTGLGSIPNWSAVPPWAGDSAWDIDLIPGGDSSYTYAGPSRSAASGTTRAILFHLPRTDAPLLSLGQLQHAPLTGQVRPAISPTLADSGQEPTYPFGNAYADPRIRQDLLLRPNTKSMPAIGITTFNGEGSEAHLTDVSYLLNRALWDRFFFSGRPTASAAELQAQIDAGAPLPNARLRWLEGTAAADAADFDRAASGLLADGAFNVNSTSVEAWAALFSSLRGVRVNPANGSATASMGGTPYVRTPYATGSASTASRSDQWAGYRTLTDAQVRDLATAMVAEVKARGPFLSLADFVNRRLIAFSDDAAGTGLSGALQAAIDAVPAINSTILETDTPVADINLSLPVGGDEGWTVRNVEYYLQNAKAPRRAVTDGTQGKAAMAPGFLSQADMLSALGSGLAARSDTFVIRAYGETINPARSPADADYVTARAWCEAVVQRLPEYVDAEGNAAHVQPVTGNTVNLTNENQSFGRRYKVVSFRWLSPENI